jgi:flagellar biosynthetic protein FlhB
MANDDRTEKPTPKRKKEARRDGKVAKSPDVSAWLILLASSVVLPWLYRSAQSKLVALVAQSTSVMADPSPAGALAMLEKGLDDVVAVVLPPAAALAAISVFATVAQSGLVVSLHAAAPKWDRLNPLTGVKNLFSTQTLWQLAKQVIKLALLVGVAYGVIAGMAHTLVGSRPVDMTPIVSYTGSRLMAMTQEVAAFGLLLGLADFAWNRHRLAKSLKMTKHEVKEENKQSEGSPLVRRELRRKAVRLSRTRMMAAVAGADVIVVNPTHYAVALRYDRSVGQAPVVVAKGAGELALRIREEGIKHKVPVLEDPPLARAIHASCELDQAIPAELFLAVARVLAFVFTLDPGVRAAGIVHRRPATALVA